MLPWRDLPEVFGPWQTVWKRHRRYATDGTWDRVLTALLALADTTGDLDWVVAMPAVLEQVAVPRLAGGPPRRNPDTVIADKAYSAASNRDLLRRKRIRSVIPQRSDQVANRKKRGRLGGMAARLRQGRIQTTQRGRARVQQGRTLARSR
ncbi:transposase, partial [Nocardia sp. NRRL WC-3656]|uniref:transposase n=1 Tax=Nocardia sp. NRRL WC-3656 TaxID=1463824 RepID=UPI0018CC3D8C